MRPPLSVTVTENPTEVAYPSPAGDFSTDILPLLSIAKYSSNKDVCKMSKYKLLFEICLMVISFQTKLY